MSSPEIQSSGVNHQNLRQFDAAQVLPDGVTLDQQVNGGLKGFLRNTLGSSRGRVGPEALGAFVGAVADYETQWPLYSAQPLRYPAVPNLPERQIACTAENTVISALANLKFMVERFAPEAFAASSYSPRRERAVVWGAPLDEDYELRVRGGSGAGTFSIDVGLGVVNRNGSQPSYKELWRTGVDTVHADGAVGARFIRTGSGIKGGDETKQQAFQEFRKRQRILPQRLLGLVGLYLMRELEPDFAVALTTPGARRLSTLGRSKSECDYSGIFANVGFLPSDDPHWLIVEDFADGFYEALERAGLRKHEAHRLHEAVEGLNAMTVLDGGNLATTSQLFALCADSGRQTLEREVALALPANRAAAEEG